MKIHSLAGCCMRTNRRGEGNKIILAALRTNTLHWHTARRRQRWIGGSAEILRHALSEKHQSVCPDLRCADAGVSLDTRYSIFTANENYTQARIAGRRNFDEFEDSLKLLHLQNVWYRRTVRTKYRCNKIHSTEIFYLFAWWCQQKKEFSHVTDLVFVMHANPISSASSETSVSTAGRVVRDRRTYLRPNTSWPYPFLKGTVAK